MPEHKIKIGILLDSYEVPLWISDILQDLTTYNFISIEAIIINNNTLNSAPVQISEIRKQNIVRKRIALLKAELHKYYLYFDYIKWDKEYYLDWWERFYQRFDHPYIDSFKIIDSSLFLRNIEEIYINPRKTRYSDFIEGTDLEKIKNKNLDVILRFGFRILKGGVLNAAKYGIWSFHHDDNNEYRGGPPLFWEVYENNALSGTILQIITPELDGGKVIYRSFSKTYNHSVYLNQNENYWKTSTFIIRRLKQQHLFGWDFICNLESYNEKTIYNKNIYNTPDNKKMVIFLSKLFIRHIKKLYREHFFYEKWYIIYKTNKKKHRIKSSKDHWYADPFPFCYNNQNNIFFEDYDLKTNKGLISFITLNDNNIPSETSIALEEPFHLSYPFIFEYKNDVYMIPESKESNSIRLYKALHYPDKWILSKILISGIDAVDTTLLFYNNKCWIFTNIATHGAEASEELSVFYADDLMGEWTPHPLNPVISDIRYARPAGAIFFEKGVLIRPSQNCLYTYGYAINLNHIEVLSETAYKESPIRTIFPSELGRYKGTHTYNKFNKIECFDVKKWAWNKNLKVGRYLIDIKYLYFHKLVRMFLKHLIKLSLLGQRK
jgi:hypothetical protein